MEEDVQNYSPTFKFRGTPCTVLYTLYCTVHPVVYCTPCTVLYTLYCTVHPVLAWEPALLSLLIQIAQLFYKSKYILVILPSSPIQIWFKSVQAGVHKLWSDRQTEITSWYWKNRYLMVIWSEIDWLIG